MKPVHVDFIPDRGPVGIWGAIALICLLLASNATFKWYQVRKAITIADARGASLRSELASRAKLRPVADPREESKRQATRLIQQDLNAAFTAVERISEPNVRLKAFSLDNVAAFVRVEYEVDSLMRASSVTFSLNAGYDTRPWVLESVSGLPTTSAPSVGVASQSGRAIWSAHLDKL